MSENLKLIQRGLSGLGHDPGPADGFWGQRTEAAVRSLLSAGGRVAASPAVGPVTELPWMAEAKRVLGRHEGRDNGWLRSWLKSDGKTLGDPAKLPWCGDFVETCIRIGLPGEAFPGALGQNPYWARNWLGLGGAIQPTYGAVLVFERGPKSGHVGFAVGQDDAAYFVLGGNQSDSVSVTRIAKARLLGARWPATAARPASPHLPQMRSGDKLSTNEA